MKIITSLVLATLTLAMPSVFAASRISAVPLNVQAIFLKKSRLASEISSITCDSQMKWGFSGDNEKGSFSYVARPFKVSVNVDSKEFPIDGSSHVCTIPIAAEPFTTTREDSRGWINLSFKSSISSDSPPDGGTLSIRDGSGTFTCADLPDNGDPGIKLTNCVVK